MIGALKNFNTFEDENFKVIFGGDKNVNELKNLANFLFLSRHIIVF